MDRTLISYRCITDHRGEPTNDNLTVHHGRWAYCPFDARARSHEWVETGGTSIAEEKTRSVEDRSRRAHAESAPRR